MANSISTLPVIELDYTGGGPGLHVGMQALEGMLGAPGGREGFILAHVKVEGAVIPVIVARADLYVLGFQSGTTWFRFDDAAWPFEEKATALGFDGQYGSLGGLTGHLDRGAIDSVAKLANSTLRTQWKEPLRTLVVMVSECARLIPVRMYVTGLLNGVVSTIPLASQAHYIQNWSKASKGTDMSKEVADGLRTGFRDPTIIKR